MGKDYWYWGSSSSGRSSSSKRGGRSETQTQIPSGCMCAIFQAFDFHPFNISLNHQQQNSASAISNHHNTVPKGAEAPRNSLESEDGTVSSMSKEETFKIPKIRTSGSARGSFSDFSSEISISSPGTKTPTLVARLMGLDLLPDSHSSSSSSSSCLSTPNPHQNKPRQHIKIMKHRHSTDSVVNRSLPETPRMSSARRSDVEHRLTLQINKENMGIGEDLEGPRFSFSKRKLDENNCRSPSHYARQIVKQVKESVSRKVGLDITNTVKNREQGREESVNQFKFKKPPKLSVKPQDESSPGKHSNQSYSPRPSRFMDTKHKSNTKSSPISPKDQKTAQKPQSPPPIVNIDAELSRVLAKPKPQALPEKELHNPKSVPKHKKPTQIRNKPQQTSIRNKQEEPFIIRPSSNTRANDIKTKSRRTHPLSTNLLNNLNTVQNLHPATKIPQKQVKIQSRESDDTQEAKSSSQLFSSSRQSTLCTRGTNGDKSNGVFTATGAADEGPEYQYITTLLSRTGVHRATSLPHFHFQWFSSSHPLDPSLFHRLEHNPLSNPFASSQENYKDCSFRQKNHLGPRCNRRLLFDLVDELLSEILVRPSKGKGHRGFLLETVWEKVRSFPRARCEVLEDIDGLIELEDVQGKMQEEGEEGLVKEIEGTILEMLVQETLTVMMVGGSRGGGGGGWHGGT